MIRQLFIVILLAFACSKEQKSDDSRPESKGTSIVSHVSKVTDRPNSSDTIFIHREVTEDYYHAIYIDTTRQSKYYKWLTDFAFNKYDKQSFDANYKYVKRKKPNSFKRKNFTDIQEQWIPVYQYKDKYYLYSPSDWGNAGKLIINDSTLIFWGWDIMSSPIQSIKKQGNSKYVLEIIDISKESLPEERLNIYIIDKKTKLAVFDFPDQPEEYRYELYIPIKSAKYFDVIVNYCKEQKQPEYEFDKIDHQKLLKGLK